MPTYDLIKDEQFAGGDTSVGSGANSTTGVPGWTDFVGNLYNVASHVCSNTRNISPGNSPPLNSLYDAANSFRDGKVIVFFTKGSSSSVGATARFNPSGGGSGYGGIINADNQLFFTKAVAGVKTNIGSALDIGSACPANAALEFIFTNSDPNTTVLTLNIYDANNLSSVLATRTTTDTTVGLQTAGLCGACSFAGMNWPGFKTYRLEAALEAGTASVTFTGKTVVDLAYTTPTGGTGPYTSQLHRGTSPDFTPSGATAIVGATTAPYHDTGRTPAGTYYYKWVSTDSAGSPATVTSNDVAVTMLTADALIFLDVGNSIFAGQLSSGLKMTETFIAVLQARGVSCAAVNVAVSGTTTGSWMPGQTLHTNAKAQAIASECNRINFMCCTNDSKVSGQVAAATVGSNIAAILASLMDNTTAITKAYLHNDPYVVPGAFGGQWDATSVTRLVEYQAQFDSLCNRSTIVRGDKHFFDITKAKPTYLADDVHPGQAGHDFGGSLQAYAVLRDIDGETGGGSVGGLFNSGGLIA